MFTFFTRTAACLNASARLRRTTAALAIAVGGMLAWTAIPAASAAGHPSPGPGAAYGPAPATQGIPVQAITAGGMPGWQITLIAVAAALVAGTAAIPLDRTRASRRTASTAR